jgi:hypothetical protein
LSTEPHPPSPDALALHIHELKGQLGALRTDNQRLRDALSLTASRRDLFNAGLAIILVFLVLGFGIIFKMDAINANTGIHFVNAGGASQAVRIVPASDVAW